MAIGLLPNAPSITYSEIARAQQGFGRVSVPVSQNHYLYARFRHVKGVPRLGPASQDDAIPSGGYSISKIYSLDRLIDRFIQVKGKEASVPDAGSMTSSSEVEAAIQDLARSLHEQISMQRSGPVLYGNPGTDHGFFINRLV